MRRGAKGDEQCDEVHKGIRHVEHGSGHGSGHGTEATGQQYAIRSSHQEVAHTTDKQPGRGGWPHEEGDIESVKDEEGDEIENVVRADHLRMVQRDIQLRRVHGSTKQLVYCERLGAGLKLSVYERSWVKARRLLG